MTETELENLVIRLTGDGSDYQRMLQKAQTSTEQAAQHVEAATKRIEGYSEGLKSFGENAVRALEAFGATEFLKKSFDMFVEEETVMLRLKAAIEANGKAVEPTIEHYEKFAKTLKAATGIGKDTTLALLQQAETMGMSGAEAERAVQAAVGLSASLGGEADHYLMVTQAIETGNAAMLGRIRQLRGLKTDQEKLAKAQELVDKSFAVAQTMASSTEGVMRRFGGTVRALTKQFGAVVADGVRPVIIWVTQQIERFTHLDDKTKRIIVTAAFLTAGLLAIGPALAMINAVVLPLVATMSSGFSLVLKAGLMLLNPIKLISAALSIIGAVGGVVFSLVGLAIAAVAIVVGVLVYKLGGLQATWDFVKDKAFVAWEWIKTTALNMWETIKQKADEFSQWIKPVLDALSSLFSATWEFVSDNASKSWDWIKTTFTAVKDYISQVLEGLGVDFTVSWGKIRDTVRDAIIYAEFVIRNFGKVWDHVTTGAALSIVRFGNQIEYVLTTVIPAVAHWFADDWQNIFTDVFNWTAAVFTDLANNIVTIFKALPGLIAGTVKWSDVWKPLAEDFQRVSKELVIPERIAGQIESQLQDDFERQGDALDRSFDEFKKQKIDQFANAVVPPKGITEAGKRGEKAGEETFRKYNQGAKAEIGKFDAALSGSAEAISRVADFMAKAEDARAGVTTTKSPTSSPALTIEAAASNSTEAAQRKDANTQILKDILGEIKDQGKKPTLELEAATL